VRDRDKRAAEAVLHDLCLGLQIVGVRWAPSTLVVAIEPVAPHAERHRSNLLLTIESRWTVFPARPNPVPTTEEDLPELSLDERVVALARLAGQDIVDVHLGDTQPHLILTVASGRILFLNGHHDHYECWNLSTGDALEGHGWLIVAVPGDAIAVFDPQNTIWCEDNVGTRAGLDAEH